MDIFFRELYAHRLLDELEYPNYTIANSYREKLYALKDKSLAGELSEKAYGAKLQRITVRIVEVCDGYDIR